MRTTIIKLIPAILVIVCARPVYGQVDIDRVLAEVEANNESLAARRRLTDAQVLEARVGNTPDDPEVEYSHKWGDRTGLGHNGSFEISQWFDFPAAYSHRNKLAKIRAEQYGHEYEAFRQQILLEATAAYVDIVSLREQGEYLERAMEFAAHIESLMSRRVETGDANALDENKAQFELAAARNAFGQNRVQLRAAESRLANLNGGIPVRIEESELQVDRELPAFDGILSAYESASPEMLAILLDRDAAERDAMLSRSLSAPRFKAGYMLDHAKNERYNGFVVGMTIPIFSNRHNVKRAKAQQLYAEAEIDRAKTELRINLEKLYGEAELLLGTLRDFEHLSQYKEAVTMLAKALDAGHISIIEYYSSLQPICQNRIDIVSLKRDYLLTLARIEMIYL